MDIRSVKAKVVSDTWLHLQCIALVSWTLLLHFNMLGLSVTAQHQLLKIFGTAWMGAIFNLATVVTFILGLFITLVVQRWFDLRATYSQLRSNTLDLAILFRNYIKPKPKEEPVRKSGMPEESPVEGIKQKESQAKGKHEDRKTLLQLNRYLQLAHVLFLNAATQHCFPKHQQTLLSDESLLMSKAWLFVVKCARLFWFPFQRAATILGMIDVSKEGQNLTRNKFFSEARGDGEASSEEPTEANDERWAKLHQNDQFGFEDFKAFGLMNELEWAELEVRMFPECSLIVP
jgi:hypothetical protein